MLRVLDQEESTTTEQLLEFSFTQQKNESVEVKVQATSNFVSTPKSRSKVAGFAIFIKYRFMDIFQVFPSALQMPQFSSSDLYMIGHKIFQKEAEKETNSSNSSNPNFIEKFLNEFSSLFWFSYRKDFHAITPSSYSSDLGWGCMLRSGQMMLGKALSIHFLGSDWKRSSKNQTKVDNSLEKQNEYRTILRWFEDSSNSPFSVHQIAKIGLKYGKNIGEWFGPTTIAQVLCELVSANQPGGMAMYVATESTIYLDEISSICKNKNGKWDSVFILIPLRLGLGTSINKTYLPHIQQLFHIPQFIGILGGKPRAAYYFVAIQDSFLFYLDPHVTQSYIPMNGDFPTGTFHCNFPQKMPIASIDPSLAIGFYLKDKKDFDEFWKLAIGLSQQDNYLFGVAEEAPEYKKKKTDLSVEEFEDDIVIL